MNSKSDSESNPDPESGSKSYSNSESDSNPDSISDSDSMESGNERPGSDFVLKPMENRRILNAGKWNAWDGFRL